MFSTIKSKKLIKLEKSHEEHCCNHCEIAYNDGFSIMFKYCSLCGRKLTLHKDHPDYKELYGFTYEKQQMRINDYGIESNKSLKEFLEEQEFEKENK